MKIIKHGKKHNIIDCDCGCVFEYDETDFILTRMAHMYCEDKNTPVYREYSVKCPECDKLYVIVPFGAPTIKTNK